MRQAWGMLMFQFFVFDEILKIRAVLNRNPYIKLLFQLCIKKRAVFGLKFIFLDIIVQ